MHIKKNDAGHFASLDEAKKYQEAMNFKKDVDGMVEEIIKFDDKVNIDFNNPAKGDVLIENQMLSKNNVGKFTGRVIYNPEDNTPVNVELTEQKFINSSRSIHSSEIKKSYNYFETEDRQVYETLERHYWNDPVTYSPESSDGEHKKLTIDKKTGNIDFE